jgi:hypothetical protein
MIVLDRIVFSVHLIVLVIELAYFGSLSVAVLRLRRQIPATECYKPSCSEWVPVPHGELAKLYDLQFPRSRALRRMGVLYLMMMYGAIVFVFLDMLSWIAR